MFNTRTDRMNIDQFLLRLQLAGIACPDRIHPDRWRAMLTWAKKRGYVS